MEWFPGHTEEGKEEVSKEKMWTMLPSMQERQESKESTCYLLTFIERNTRLG